MSEYTRNLHFDGPNVSHDTGISDEYLQSINRDPITMFDVVPPGADVPTSGTVRFIVPLGSMRIVTKVTTRYVPNDAGIPFPNLRLVTGARLWVALRDRNRRGNEGHVVGVRNVIGSRANPVLIPSPFEAAADADGLAGYSVAFGGPSVLLEQSFLVGATSGLLTPTGIYDEAIGELSITSLGAPGCPPGQWVLQTRWEPSTTMDPREWSKIKSLLDPRVGRAKVATFNNNPPP